MTQSQPPFNLCKAQPESIHSEAALKGAGPTTLGGPVTLGSLAKDGRRLLPCTQIGLLAHIAELWALWHPLVPPIRINQ